MEHVHYEVDVPNGGSIEVTLDQQANVLVMDSMNYQQYCRGASATYYGGRMVRSPAVITPPHGGWWHVAIDLGRGSGTIRSSVRVL